MVLPKIFKKSTIVKLPHFSEQTHEQMLYAFDFISKLKKILIFLGHSE